MKAIHHHLAKIRLVEVRDFYRDVIGYSGETLDYFVNVVEAQLKVMQEAGPQNAYRSRVHTYQGTLHAVLDAEDEQVAENAEEESVQATFGPQGWTLIWPVRVPTVGGWRADTTTGSGLTLTKAREEAVNQWLAMQGG